MTTIAEAPPETKSGAQLEKLCINTIRTLSMDAVQKANSGHPGAPMENASIAYTLWTKFLRYNPKNPSWQNRDRFVLSAGHGSMLLYSMLYLTGYDLSLDDIKNFRQWDSKTPGHPEYGLTPGVETSTGPLGQGFANGVGMAIQQKYLASYFNRPGHEIFDYKVYAIVSDGDLMEGVASEAASLAGHLKLNNLIYIYSDNKISIEGSTGLAFTEDAGDRFRAYDWQVLRVEGNNLKDIAEAVTIANQSIERPTLIVARTHIGYGSPHKQDSREAHGEALGVEEVKLTKEAYGWPPDKQFYVPDEVLQFYRQQVDIGAKREAEWQKRFDAYAKEFPDLAAQWQQWISGKLPEGWDSDFPDFKGAKPLATRNASGEVMNAFAKKLPNFLGGSADLAPSTMTHLKEFGDFEPGNYSGRNFHYGVREHAMGSVNNGIAVGRTLIPFGATFLIFSDYQRPTIRLAAMMEVQQVFVYTHDSIGLGEDGPTHQSIEQLPSLRAIPNLFVVRPADHTETAEAWRIAINRRTGPTALVLTRQKVPVIDRDKYAPASGVQKGGYILSEAKDGKVDVILIATGSEVHLALDAQTKLAEQGVGARVVSFPCIELFLEQSEEYRNEVLPRSVSARVAIEAAMDFGWHRWVGYDGDVIAMKRFGASSPGEVLFEKFGFTVDNVVNRAKALVKK
ncbi:MAG TPA: transketolase [Blastocatellia bacterium]|nr:transketolase [Blastocatellia bacterium]